MRKLDITDVVKYVEGNSEDYVCPCDDYIEDYGKISDKGFIELLFRYWKIEDVKSIY